MSHEEKIYITKIIRNETSCGLKEASDAIDKLIDALKHKPLYIMDKPANLKITLEYDE
jgi:ribosomal protein L7/L12